MTRAIETRGLSRSFAGVRTVDAGDLRVERGTLLWVSRPERRGQIDHD